MVAAAQRCGRALATGFCQRYFPAVQFVKRTVESGAIGELTHVRAYTGHLGLSQFREAWMHEKKIIGGGALMDVGCYCVNLSRTIVGEEPVEVQATASRADTGVDEHLVGILRFPSGVIAHFDCALTMERCEFYEVAGTEAHLRVPSAFLPGTADAPIEEHRGRGDTVIHTIPGADEYQLMVEHFADCVLDDEQPRYPAAEAARNMRVIEALYESIGMAGASVEVGDAASGS